MTSASSATTAAWISGLNAWLEFCEARGAAPVSPPADVVLAFVDDLRSRYRYSTVQSRTWAVTRLHVLMLRPSPMMLAPVRAALAEAAAAAGPRRRRAKTLTGPDLDTMVAASQGYSGQGYRDRAMLRLAFDARPTSAQLVAIDVEHIMAGTDGAGRVVLAGTRSSTGPLVRPLQPKTMAAIAEWRFFSEIAEGALFRSIDRWGTIGQRLKPRQLEHCIRRTAEAAGLGSHWSCLSIRSAERDEAGS